MHKELKYFLFKICLNLNTDCSIIYKCTISIFLFCLSKFLKAILDVQKYITVKLNFYILHVKLENLYKSF